VSGQWLGGFTVAGFMQYMHMWLMEIHAVFVLLSLFQAYVEPYSAAQ
jgi:hypothetical protein